jgi:hypothetical protein
VFRFLEKKRGERRTGSNLVGGVGEALIYGCLLLVGVMLLTALIVNQLMAPDPGSFALGVGRWLGILVMASFVIIGGGGLVWSVLRMGTSAEFRGAIARQASELDLVQDGRPRSKHYPAIPAFEGLTNSPGVELAYRLPPTQSPGWRLMATTIFAWSWLAVGGVLSVWAISSHLAGQPEWFLTIFLLPFLIVGAWSIRYWLRQIWIDTGMGLTTVEISDCPLEPGRVYQVVLAQHGHIRVKSLELWLICEEEATYRQGTDIRTEVRRVVEERLSSHRDFRIEPIEPFRAAVSVAIPAAAMHSFHSLHNSVNWKLVVRGEVAHWPRFERGFPIVVYPGEATLRIPVSANVARLSRRPQVASLPAALASEVPAGTGARA